MIKLTDILKELNIQPKPKLGSGTEASVYDFATQPDKVIKYHPGDMFGMADRSWDEVIDIMEKNPNIFVKLYKADPKRKYLVIEKVDAKRVVNEIEQITKILINEDNKNKELFFAKYYDYRPPTFQEIYNTHGIIDVINIVRIGILKNNTDDIKLMLNILKPYSNLLNSFKKWVEFIRLVNSKIGLILDFSFENIGYDKQENLKMFDF